ncbi:MAG: site-specific DNA-methyltransferase, partial [Selenomonadaceae bacterium]|nr:site-specific DNA-methyltransferase [Selenomonadaceae bacterium]
SQKPLELIEKIVKNTSREGDVVLECFMGSGTTAEACIKTNRHFIGFEIDEKYYKIANERISKARAEKAQALF